LGYSCSNQSRESVSQVYGLFVSQPPMRR
jgi:hypothetical protein